MEDMLIERGGAVDPTRQILDEEEDEIELEIDRDVDGSFPASDPPGWVLGTECGYRFHNKPEDGTEEKP